MIAWNIMLFLSSWGTHWTRNSVVWSDTVSIGKSYRSGIEKQSKQANLCLFWMKPVQISGAFIF